MEFPKSKKKVLVTANNSCSSTFWWTNYFKPGLSCSTFYLYNFLTVVSILGISAFYHDSAAAILIDGEIIAAAQEERFTRKKHDSSFPKNAVDFVLKYSTYIAPRKHN